MRPRFLTSKITTSGLITVVLCCAAVLGYVDLSRAAEQKLVTEEFMIASADPGIELYVRNKHPKQLRKLSGDRTLLLVHGATYPGEATFDLKLNGVSMMEFIAEHGFDVYLVDVRGYGKSTRPLEMNQPADQNPPIVHTDTAVKDISSAVDFICKRRGVSKVNLIGWSWGTAIVGWYATQHSDRVNKVVLYAPRWLANSTPPTNTAKKLGAYRTVEMMTANTLVEWCPGWQESGPDSQRLV